MKEIPSIIIFSENEKKINNFVNYLKNEFKFLEYYNDEYKKVIFDKYMKENFFIKKIAKIQLNNKYYTADVIISSIVNNIEEIKENENEKTKEKIYLNENKHKKDDIIDNDIKDKDIKYMDIKNMDIKDKEIEDKDIKEIINVKEINIKNIFFECIIFLFDDFTKKEKDIINFNPFRCYDEDCFEFIKNKTDSTLIKNENFDYSNLYKDIAIKLIIFPVAIKIKKNEIIRHFSEYFLECLFIDYNTTNLLKKEKENENKNEINNEKIDYTDNEYDEKRLVEAIHCHMWKGLEIKKKQKKNNVETENEINKENFEKNKDNNHKKNKNCKSSKENKKGEENEYNMQLFCNFLDNIQSFKSKLQTENEETKKKYLEEFCDLLEDERICLPIEDD